MTWRVPPVKWRATTLEMRGYRGVPVNGVPVILFRCDRYLYAVNGARKSKCSCLSDRLDFSFCS